jgi:hypothetical protein
LTPTGEGEPRDAFVLGEAPFWPVDHVTEPEAWAGHIPFAFWIVDSLRPRLLVELGTHSGNSYLAFCQAVQGLGLSTACFAVDTWMGDAQSGLYGEEVFVELSRYHDHRYGAFSRLVRATFDEAVQYFSDGSVDLLHVDGLHTYETVRHDFDTWRPKLSERAVVLLHDINVREREFGVWRLWEELRARHPHFAFLHAHGLGVLGIGADLPGSVIGLLESTSDASRVRWIRDMFARQGESVVNRLRVDQLRERTESLQSEVHRLGEAVAAQDEAISRQTEAAERIHDGARALEKQAGFLKGEIDQLRETVRRRDEELGRLQATERAQAEELAGLQARERARAEEVGQQLELIKGLQQEIVRLGKLVETGRREVGSLQERVRQEEHDRARVDREVEALRAELSAVYASRFWRLTRPLRHLPGWYRTARGRLTS